MGHTGSDSPTKGRVSDRPVTDEIVEVRVKMIIGLWESVAREI